LLLAVLPSDALLTVGWDNFLKDYRHFVTTHSGIVAFENSPLAHRPDSLLVENWVISTQSLVLRSKYGDAIVLPPQDFKDWVPFPPLGPPNIGHFYWRD
jgi:hypothetical protein